MRYQPVVKQSNEHKTRQVETDKSEGEETG